ncbi:MAG: OmpH family outer membrane protein [Opitutaceae bacterium]|jgi:outer membrane protein
MNKHIRSAFAITALALSTLTAQAQTAPKILVVDLAKLFENHWKTHEMRAKLEVDKKKAEDKLEEIGKDGSTLMEQFKDYDDQSRNPASTADAKARAQAEAQRLYNEIQKKRSDQEALAQDTRNNLQQQFQTFENKMLVEITKVAVDVAKTKGATFLIDKSGPTLVGVSNILYYDPSLDITVEVAAAIDRDRPATAPKSTISSAPAPAAPSSATVTVPAAPANN